MHEETVQIHRGDQVMAGGEAIGEVIDELAHAGERYIHVRRFGPGEDDLYIPHTAASHVTGKHVYLSVNPEDLLGEAWHIPPGSQSLRS